ncbi:hypothetical protein MBLNU13_g00606t1 [Cladosporium sp. NU13]
MPTRAPPTIPQQNVSAPPPPTYAPPPVPVMKEKPSISVTELSISDGKQMPGLQRSKSMWSRREIVGVSSFKERREAKARAAAAMPEIDVVLPPLSPIVDEEFWRTGNNEAFYIFLAWLLYNNIGRAVNSQTSLAEAWNFGAKHLMPCLQDTYVCSDAVLEAYTVNGRDTLLQRAFVAQLANDTICQTGTQLEEKVFTKHKMEKVAGLYLALTQAMCVTFDHNKCAERSIKAADFLHGDTDE